MGIYNSKVDRGDWANEEDEMKYSSDTVDIMAYSKVKRELLKYGITPEELCREKLKECVDQQVEPDSMADEDVGSPGRHTRSKKRTRSMTEADGRRKKVPKEEDTGLYEVDKLLDVRECEDSETTATKRQFLVRWKGYTDEDDQWIDEEDLSLAPEKYIQDEVVIGKLNSLIHNP